MLEKIKRYVMNYYLLDFESNENITLPGRREIIIKTMLTRILYITCPIAGILLLSVIFHAKTMVNLIFPLFLISLIPYYIYRVMLNFLKKEAY